MESALPIPIDRPMQHRALHELRVDRVETKVVRVVVGTIIELGSKIVGCAVHVGDTCPNPVIEAPDSVHSFVSHGSASSTLPICMGSFCEGFRMPARDEGCGTHRGRCPKASRERTRER